MIENIANSNSTNESRATVLGRLKNSQALLVDGDDLVIEQRNQIFRLDKNGQREHLFKFKSTALSKLLNRSRLLYRLRRRGVFSAAIHDGSYFFARQGELWSFAPGQAKPTLEFEFPRGNGPLQFTSISDVPEFDSSIYFGEYFRNDSALPVDIFRRNTDGTWDVCYTFGEGEINHVHTMIPDRFNNCIWILTGDFDNAAAIWKAEKNFESVKRVVSGHQKFRSCVAYATPRGLLYATDSQFETNQIRLLTEENGEWVSIALHQLNGSCIDGCELRDYLVFSTATEPNTYWTHVESPTRLGRLWGYLIWLFDNRPGPGILLNQTDIVVCKKNDMDQISIIHSVEKDIFPYRLFQFGRAKFPIGKNDSNRLHAYFIATKQNDLCTVSWQLSDVHDERLSKTSFDGE